MYKMNIGYISFLTYLSNKSYFYHRYRRFLQH